MIVIAGTSPNCAYFQLLRMSLTSGLPRLPSRIGQYADLGAVTVEFSPIGERIPFLKARGFNPYFAMIEAAWILAGQRDLATLRFAISDFGQYSDDQETLNGAYGYRLRHYFQNIDQLDRAVHELKNDRGSRRVVLSLYSPDDLGKPSADIPCNTQINFRIVSGELEMTVTNRSNDLFFGVPLNWFNFWCIQQWVARQVGISSGTQRHVSSCMHLYVKDFPSALRVATANSEAVLNKLEAEMLSFPIDEFLDNFQAIAGLRFSEIATSRLLSYFETYLARRDDLGVDEKSSGARDAVCYSADDWFACRRERRMNKLEGEMMAQRKANSDSLPRLSLNTWVWETASSDIADVVGKISSVIVPRLSEYLTATTALPTGVTMTIKQGSEEQLAKLLVLELLKGTLDPALHRSDIGKAYSAKLSEIASLVGVDGAAIGPREISDSEMKTLFGPLFG